MKHGAHSASSRVVSRTADYHLRLRRRISPLHRRHRGRQQPFAGAEPLYPALVRSTPRSIRLPKALESNTVPSRPREGICWGILGRHQRTLPKADFKTLHRAQLLCAERPTNTLFIYQVSPHRRLLESRLANNMVEPNTFEPRATVTPFCVAKLEFNQRFSSLPDDFKISLVGCPCELLENLRFLVRMVETSRANVPGNKQEQL